MLLNERIKLVSLDNMLQKQHMSITIVYDILSKIARVIW